MQPSPQQLCFNEKVQGVSREDLFSFSRRDNLCCMSKSLTLILSGMCRWSSLSNFVVNVTVCWNGTLLITEIFNVCFSLHVSNLLLLPIRPQCSVTELLLECAPTLGSVDHYGPFCSLGDPRVNKGFVWHPSLKGYQSKKTCSWFGLHLLVRLLRCYSCIMNQYKFKHLTWRASTYCFQCLFSELVVFGL